MPHCLVTISYTSLHSSGGVPKFNRDLHSAFPDRECAHFCWDDFPWHLDVDARGETEWGKARILNEYLIKSRKVTTDDVVIADGFWADGLECLPYAVSHSHGIWSHLTHEDVLAGKSPDMPLHHAAQVAFRKRWIELGKHITAVSDFIAEQMRLQWGFVVDRIINNGVDTDVYKPSPKSSRRSIKPLIIHGVNDRGNANKGFDHIEFLQTLGDRINLMSLDEAHEIMKLATGKKFWSKAETLAEADLVVHPSGYEGNSLFVAETLSCGVPIVAYDVGYLAAFSGNTNFGHVIPRTERSPERTLQSVMSVLLASSNEMKIMGHNARSIAPSIKQFSAEWRSYIEEIENA